MQHIWARREMCTTVWFKNLKGRNHLGDFGVGERILLKFMLN
jgi:hypothetical protein